MSQTYRTKHGKFHNTYTKRRCVRCKKVKKIQQGTDLCNSCLLDITEMGMTSEEWRDQHVD